MTTNVPDIQWTPTGIVLPLESAILAGVQQDIDGAFGGGVNPDLSTPQGQLAMSETAVIGDKNDTIAQYVNQVDPAFAEGRMQDAIARIYFLDRNPAQPTVAQCVCMGRDGVVITAGSIALDTANNQYVCVTGGVIASGSVTLQFQAVVPGPTILAANQLNRIYSAIAGWDSINNPANGVTGKNVESRADFEFRREQSVALNGHGSLPSIKANVLNVPNVLDCYATENVTSSPAIIGSTNYALVPHSLYVGVSGGDPNAIANAIWNKKDVGCDYNGNTTVVVNDTVNYSPPYPAYDVTFNIATPTAGAFAVQIQSNTNLPADIATQIQNAIVNAFNGLNDSVPRARIGSTVNAANYYCPLADLNPFLAVNSIMVGPQGGTLASQWKVGIDQAPTLTADNVVVTQV